MNCNKLSISSNTNKYVSTSKNYKLKNINYLLSGLHLFAALGLLVYMMAKKNSIKYFNFELYAGSKTYSVSSRTLIWLAISFLFITSIFHLLYALNLFNYYNNVINGRQSIRWLEYGITATIMAFIVAVISGVRDVYTLAALTALSVGIMSTGLWFENALGVKSVYIPLFVGFLLLAIYSVIVFMNWLDTKKRIESTENKKIPTWITYIVIGTLLFFGCFGIVPLIKYYFDNFTFTYYEYAYMALSATAKLYLGGILAYGLLKRTE